MLSKLEKLLDDYLEITNKQTKAIEKSDIEKLNYLIEKKGSLIKEIRAILQEISINDFSEKLKEKVILINNLEKDNLEDLNVQKKKLVKDHSEVKEKEKGLKEYAKFEK